MRANSVKPMHSNRFKNRNNPQREGIKWFFLNSPTHISAVSAAGKGPTCTQIQARRQDPRSSPYQYKRLPQAKQSRKVQNSLWPWFSGLNKDSSKDWSYGPVSGSPSTPGAGSNVQHLEDRARCKKRDHILKACLRWGIPVAGGRRKARQGLSSSQRIIGSAQIS